MPVTEFVLSAILDRCCPHDGVIAPISGVGTAVNIVESIHEDHQVTRSIVAEHLDHLCRPSLACTWSLIQDIEHVLAYLGQRLKVATVQNDRSGAFVSFVVLVALLDAIYNVSLICTSPCTQDALVTRTVEVVTQADHSFRLNPESGHHLLLHVSHYWPGLYGLQIPKRSTVRYGYHPLLTH